MRAILSNRNFRPNPEAKAAPEQPAPGPGSAGARPCLSPGGLNAFAVTGTVAPVGEDGLPPTGRHPRA